MKVELKKLNLGCGRDIRKEYINVDFEKFSGVDKVYDLNKVPYPFRENQFEEVVMKCILEHLENPFLVMKEIHRISKQGARVSIRVPHFSSNNVWGDIQHKRGFSSQTFSNENISNMFEISRQAISFSHFRFFMRPIAKLNPLFYEKHLAYLFPAVDLVVELKVKK